MKTFLVYLAGPITGLTYDNCTEWRQQVKDSVPSHIMTLSPMRGKQRLKEISENKPILDCYNDNPLTTEKGINVRDYYDVQRSDLIFVNLLGAKSISIGTVMEIAWARAFGKPTIVLMEKEGNVHNHSMVKYASSFIIDNLEEGIELLKIVLGPDQKLN